MQKPARHPEWLVLALITLGAGALRLTHLGAVRLDPFYDAAVRSMTLSWHNFFFGAFEPGGSVSIDKPPLDLWLQVASVKLFGFGSTSLKLPEALAGTCSVPLLYAAVRRVFGVRAGLGAAVAMAVLPVEVITSRSDTMDAVMMMLLVLGLLLAIRACEGGRTIWLLAAAAALGLAFNVKLLESLVALPGLALLAYLGQPAHSPHRRRLLQMLGAVAVYVAVSLSWLTATLLFPAHERPFAIGSSNGSAWNAAFVFNGLDRITGRSVESQQEGFLENHHYPQATQSERDHIPITPPSPTRLLDRVGPLSGERLGLEVLAALLLGLPALLLGARGERDGSDERGPPLRETPVSRETPGSRDVSALRETPALRRALGIGLVVWTVTGIALFSEMSRLHPRYVEGFTPAVAALLGIGAAWATEARDRARLTTLLAALVLLLAYGEHLLFGTSGAWWVALAATICAGTLAVIRHPGTGSRRGALHTAALLAATLLAVLAIPLRTSLHAVSAEVSDAGSVGALHGNEQQLLSSYLTAHQGSARYELAADSATKVASLIVHDARPVVVLTTYNARTLTSIATLRRLIARGEVRYALLTTLCGPHTPRTNAACSAPALWVRAHGLDVSKLAGLPRPKLLWRLPRSVA